MRLPRFGRRGIAATEFALLAPVLVLLLLGTKDVADALQTSIQLEGAVRAGAQQALATPGDLASVRDAIMAASPGLTSAEVPLPTMFCECGTVAATCGAPCSAGEARYLNLTARRALSPALISSMSWGSGHAVVRTR